MSIPDSAPVKAVVGVGASAGGLDAFSLLLKSLPADTGMAFVLVQHLEAHHPSSLGEILGRATPMPVLEATEGLRVRANTVVVIPPNTEMTVIDGTYHLENRPLSASPLPVDALLRSLAIEFGDRAIGIVLSGSGSDGCEGLLAIKEAGGITFAQDPATADSPGMPAMAVAAGGVDFVLAPEAVAGELERLARDPRMALLPMEAGGRLWSASVAITAEQIRAVCDLMHEATGIDFALYRESTVVRRLARRLALVDAGDVNAYLALLATNPEERAAFQRDLLIGVTRFFREPESFDVLKSSVFPELLRGRSPGSPVRVWVPGCSTGEEAYSIVIALEEFQLAQGTAYPVQLFASDLSDAAIETARAGVYPEGIVNDVGPERLARCFTKVDGGYRIAAGLRERCVFSRHNLLDDPPFSRLDLISCRNVLIYLEAVRKTIIPLFHYALLDHGFLMLGRSESARFPYLFEPVEARLRIYRKVHGDARSVRFPASTGSVRLRGESDRSMTRDKLASLSLPADLGREADRVLLAKYAPAAIVLGSSREVLEIRGDAAPFLRLPSGALSFHLGRLLADKGLFLEVEALLSEAGRSGRPSRRDRLPWSTEGRLGEVGVEVVPLEVRGSRGHLVVFEPRGGDAAGPRGDAADAEADVARIDRIARLEQDLHAARERVVEVVGEYDASEQESQRILEDALSSNEELQSLTEELETAKEELRSTNEELVSLNAELEARNAALASARHLASSIVETIGLPLLVLDDQLRIHGVNPSFAGTYGVDGEAVEGQHLFSAWDGVWDIPELRGMLDTALPDDVSFERFETSVRFPAVGSRSVVVIGCRLRGHGRILLTVEDITARKLAEKALHDSEDRRVQAEKMEVVGRLAGGIAHDFNNLLTVVIGHSDLLALRLAGNRLAGDHVEPIRQSAERAAMLTDQLLTFSRRKVVQPKNLDLGVVLTEFERMLRRVLGEHIEIDVRIPPGLWSVRADTGEMGRVVMNLALNARDAMPGGGTLVLEVGNRFFTGEGDAPEGLPAGRYVGLTVQDDGQGVDAELQKHIFEPFFTTKNNSRGTGLGLPTVQAIVHGCGGAVTCESTIGLGTRMAVLLPAVDDDTDTDTGRADGPSLESVTRGNRELVLLVEDDPAVRGIARHVLESTGYVVVEAADGRDALGKMASQQGRVDLLLTDVVMPGMGGRELAERAVADRPGLKVLFMSGHTEDMLLKAGVSQGAAFLHKPFSPEQLARKVREVLDGR